MKRIVSVLAGALTLSLVALPAAADARAGRPTVHIHVTSTKQVVAPDTLRPGLVHVRNMGVEQIYLVRRVKAKWGVTTFVKDYNAVTPTGLARHFHTLDSLFGHRGVFITLHPGIYFFADGAPAKITAASVHVVRVKGTVRNAAQPASTAVPISGTSATLGAPSTLPTHRYLHFQNKTRYSVVVVLFGIGSGTSAAELAAFVAKPSFDKLGKLDLRSGEELWSASSHVSLYYHYHAAAGRYLMVDYAFTDPAKPPRLGKGQAVAIRVR